MPFLLFLALLACTCTGEAPLDATEQAMAEILEAEEQGPEAVLRHLRALEDPAQQELALAYLLQERPDAAEVVCRELQAPHLQRTCDARVGRVHLWTKAVTHEVAEGENVAGPLTHQLVADDSLASAYAEVRGDVGRCSDVAVQDACLGLAGPELAREGDADEAASRCAAIAGTRHRSECFFASAEALVGEGEADRVEDASQLCLAAGEFRTRCFAHLLLSASSAVPAADEVDPDEARWEAIAEYIEAIARWWRPHDAEAAVIAEQRAWAGVTLQSIQQARVLTGDLLDRLPEEHHGHVRAAAAWKLLNEGQATRHDLDGWVAQLEADLARRATGTASDGSGARRPPSVGTDNLWPPSIPGPAGMTATLYLANSRRLLARDPTVDLAICVVEAAARLPADQGALILLQAASSPHAEVAWTATRLSSLRQSRPPKGATPPRQQPQPGAARPGGSVPAQGPGGQRGPTPVRPPR